jgi:predicted GNAT family N-acyltransferase
MAISVMNNDGPIDLPPPVDSAQLPPSNDDDIELVIATFSEHMQTSRLNGNEWRGPLTIEQYLKREKHLLAQDLTKDGKEVAWLLTSSRLPLDQDGNRSILASCETIPMQAYSARDGKLKEVLIHGIGSVYTRSEHRGKSYASRMMTELGKKLETFQQYDGDRSPFSVLYSDIGQKFYARFGWQAFASTHIHLAAITDDDYQHFSKDLPTVTNLMADDLSSIPATDYLKEDLLSFSRSNPGKTVVTVAPDLPHFRWHHAREDFVSRALGRSLPKVKGAIHRESGIAIIWTRTYAAAKAGSMLHILHVAMPPALRESDDAQKILEALLLRAQQEANLSEMPAGVELWDPSDAVISAARKLRSEKGDDLRVIQRDEEHICSLRWTGADASPSDVIWMSRAKYAWC